MVGGGRGQRGQCDIGTDPDASDPNAYADADGCAGFGMLALAQRRELICVLRHRIYRADSSESAMAKLVYDCGG